MKLLVVALCLAFLGCGPTVPAGGVPRPLKPGGIQTADDLIPADLDMVVRVDLAQVRASLGAEASLELLNQGFDRSGVQGAAREALAEADVVWLGLRISDIELGDHVMVARRDSTKRAPPGKSDWLKPEKRKWKSSATPLGSVRRYVAKSSTDRAGTARIYGVGDEAAVFVSPVEEHSVERVIMRGADPERGQPQARGIMSVDIRAPRLPPDLAQDFRHIAKLIAGIDRIRGVVDIRGTRLELTGTVRCRDARAATKLHAYLTTFTDMPTRYVSLLDDLRLTRDDDIIKFSWIVPREVILALFVPADKRRK